MKWTINPWPYLTYRVGLKRFAVPTSCSRSWVDRHSTMLNETRVPVPLQRATISNSYSTRNKGQINTADFPITRYKLNLNFVKWTINPWPYFTYRVWLKRFAVPTSCSRSWVDRHSIMLNETSVPASSFFAWERNNCFPQFPISIPTSLANKMLTMHQR